MPTCVSLVLTQCVSIVQMASELVGYAMGRENRLAAIKAEQFDKRYNAFVVW